MRASIAVALWLVPVDALACLTCVGAPWEKSDYGIFWSTLFLMGLPVLVAGLIGGWLVYQSRRVRGHAPRWASHRFIDIGKESQE